MQVRGGTAAGAVGGIAVCVAAMPVLSSKLFRRHQSPRPGTGCGAVSEASLQWFMAIGNLGLVCGATGPCPSPLDFP